MSSPKKLQRRKSKKNALDVVNLPKYVCHHLVGEDHPKSHRMIVGAIVMTTGVVIVKLMSPIHFLQLHIIGDILGYGIHALGSVPFIDHIIENSKTAREERKEEKRIEKEEEAEEKDII